MFLSRQNFFVKCKDINFNMFLTHQNFFVKCKDINFNMFLTHQNFFVKCKDINFNMFLTHQKFFVQEYEPCYFSGDISILGTFVQALQAHLLSITVLTVRYFPYRFERSCSEMMH
uniref:Uncharacterized protein n=1 Tax=Cacopsylla melanoneura TaxID=428564 RepID=A0A8D8S600_9HEMI